MAKTFGLNCIVPDIGSTWKARDGRIMKVIRIVPAGIGENYPRALLSVLNPGHRMKGFTEISCSNFAGKKPFFTAYQEQAQ